MRVVHEFVDYEDPAWPFTLPWMMNMEVLRTTVLRGDQEDPDLVRFTHYVRKV